MKISRKALLFALLSTSQSRVKYLASSYQFNKDSISLIDAVSHWVSDPAQAEADFGPISTWDVSEVTSMNCLFCTRTYFNDNISDWKTSQVTDMSNMFNGAAYFNQDLSGWDTSSVTDMQGMFADTIAFDQDLSAWRTSNVTNMFAMFYKAASFNQDLSAWDTSRVTLMAFMFEYTQAFNQDLSSWDTTNVSSMAYMFFGTTAFRQTLCWDVSHIDTFEMLTQSNGRVSDCAPTFQPTSKPSDQATTVKPTLHPTPKCMDDTTRKFLKAVEMKDYDFIPVMRSCEWLQKQKRAIRERICNRLSFYNSPTAKEICKVTCQNCEMN